MQTDKVKLSRLLLMQKARQLAFAADRERWGPMTIRVLIVCFCLSLVACTGSKLQRSTDYPVVITGLGQSDHFPKLAAGYTRGETVFYAPENWSVSYDISKPSLRNAVTLYFYDASASLTQRYAAEKQLILDYHRGATLVSESSTTFREAGVAYPAHTAVFSYTGILAHRKQPLFSQLILVAHPEGYFKVRSTAPASQAAEAKTGTQELLKAIHWIY